MNRHYWSSKENDAHKQGHEDERYGRYNHEHNCSFPRNDVDRAYCEGRTDERREKEMREAEERRQEEEREEMAYARRQEELRQVEEEEHHRQMEEEE